MDFSSHIFSVFGNSTIYPRKDLAGKSGRIQANVKSTKVVVCMDEDSKPGNF